MIGESAGKCRIAIPPPSDTERDLVDVPNFTALEYTTILNDFRRRLEEMTSYAEQVGALPVLILPPANDAGFEPNRSFLPPTTPLDERIAFGREFLAAKTSETANPAACDQAISSTDRPPALFRRDALPTGRSPRASRSWDEAYQEYMAARDLDGMPMRCPTTCSSRFTARWRRGITAS